MFAILDFMKFPDSTAKDALMHKFGMVQAVLTTPPVQLDLLGTQITTDAIQKLSIVVKTQNGTEPCVFVQQAIIKLTETFALDAHPTPLGMEKPVTLKFQPTVVEATKFSSVENVSAKMASLTLKELALNVLKEPLGMENTVTVLQPPTGAWVNQIQFQPTEAVHVLSTTLSSTDAAFENDFIYSRKPIYF